MLTSFNPSAARSKSPPVDRTAFNRVLKTDTITGLTEFPEPGDTKKHLLPIFVDPEEAAIIAQQTISKEDTSNDKKEFWMPDKFCKVCYGCEDAFTMYRRRHHCRMCGQVFCNPCSSFYIDGALINLSGPVRACRLCHDQLFDRSIRENKQMTNRRIREIALDEAIAARQTDAHTGAKLGLIHETPSQKMFHTNNLQKRASDHFSSIVLRLVRNCDVIEDTVLWSNIIIHLVREVVSSVDPNVRNGDSLDIRPYVKIKIIPGGSINENTYINGVVFRKNVSHKKMAVGSNKVNPRVLLLSGSIDFQRTDTRLASMDTLIEQEDKYIELLIEKIMSLRPDIILVGKAVARRAQELLCEHNVVVMQNVKPQLLERISRMTNAIMLQSTDHMIQQYGDECLGTCGKFHLRLVQDNLEKSKPDAQKANRVLRTRILRGSTFAYFEGCPAEKGCTLVLRGADRPVLAEVKRIIQFCVMVAYHLRLEVAYYNDRFAQLPLEGGSVIPTLDSDGEDEQDTDVNSWELRKSINQWFVRKSTGSFDLTAEDVDKALLKTSSDLEPVATPVVNNSVRLPPPPESTLLSVEAVANANAPGLHKTARLMLSSSLDVDIGLASTKDLRGTNHYLNTRAQLLKVSILDHQSLLVTSLLMNDDNQRSKPEVKGIRFYTPQDVALGQFLIENCFQLHKMTVRDSSMLDHVLSFAHRNSRIDVAVKKVSTVGVEDGSFVERDPMNLPILMYSYCKECCCVVTPEIFMSDETWKMSFGKFMEMSFYNRSAFGRTNNCQHCVRDCHSLIFCCEGYEAKFDVMPVHPYALHVRTNMGEFPAALHTQHVVDVLHALPGTIIELVDLFLRTILTLENIARDVMINKQDELSVITQDFRYLEIEIKASINAIINEICICADHLSNQLDAMRTARPISGKFPSLSTIPEAKTSSRVLLEGNNLIDDSNEDKSQSSSGPVTPKVQQRSPVRSTSSRTSSDCESEIIGSSMLPPPAIALATSVPNAASLGIAMAAETPTISPVVVAYGNEPNTSDPILVAGVVTESDCSEGQVDQLEKVIAVPVSESIEPDAPLPIVDEIAYSYPLYFKREALLKARQWSSRLDQAYRFIEQVRQEALLNALQQQQTGTALPNLAALQITPLHALSNNDQFAEGTPIVEDPENDDDDDGSSNQLGIRKFIQPSSSSAGPGLSPERNSLRSSTKVDQTEAPGLITSSGFSDVDINSVGIAGGSSRSVLDESSERPEGLRRELSAVKAALAENADSLDPRRSKAVSTRNVQPSSSTATAIASLQTTSSKKKENAYHLPKALARLMGKESDGKQKSIIALGSMEEGRLYLKPGRKGEVIAVHEDEPATIIAYSLASEEYYLELQKFFGAESDYVDSDLGSAMASGVAESKVMGAESTTSVKDANGDFRSNRDLENDLFAEYQTEATGADRATAAASVSMNEKSKQVHQAFASALNDGDGDVSNYDSNFSSFSGSSLFGSTAGQVTATSGEAASSIGSGPSSTHIGSDIEPGYAPIGTTGASTLGVNQSAQLPSTKASSSDIQKQLMSQRKIHARHSFEDCDEKRNVLNKFVCTSYWAGQFEALRKSYLKEDENEGFIKSLSMSARWGAQGGKSGAHFSKSMDERFVVKVVSKVELQMFLDFAPAYFEYMAKSNLPTILCKVLGIYSVGCHNKETGKKMMENVVVMENIFYKRNITKVFDLKGSSRARYVEMVNKMEPFDVALGNRRARRRKGQPAVPSEKSSQVLLDDNLMELTNGRPFPLKHRAKMFFQKAVMNDTLFLSLVNVVDYSILVGFDEVNHEIVVGIIDYLRQYDLAKSVESMGKSVTMLTGQAQPTIIQPLQYKKRFYLAMERYFMSVPDKWIGHET